MADYVNVSRIRAAVQSLFSNENFGDPGALPPGFQQAAIEVHAAANNNPRTLALTVEYQQWVEAQGWDVASVPSADEFLGFAPPPPDLSGPREAWERMTPEQRAWVADFVGRWDEAQAADDDDLLRASSPYPDGDEGPRTLALARAEVLVQGVRDIAEALNTGDTARAEILCGALLEPVPEKVTLRHVVGHAWHSLLPSEVLACEVTCAVGRDSLNVIRQAESLLLCMPDAGCDANSAIRSAAADQCATFYFG